MNPGGWTRRVGRLKALSSQEENKFGARGGNFSVERTAAILLKKTKGFYPHGGGKFLFRRIEERRVRVRLFSSFKQRTRLLPSAGRKESCKGSRLSSCAHLLRVS
jgi:hypothetical protein